MLRALVCCCWICRRGVGGCDQRARRARAGSGSLPAPTDQACRRARASQGRALRVAAKTRPALTGPARDGCEIWRSGWKNARGAGRTKEWTLRSEGLIFAEQVELPRVVITSGCDGVVVTAYFSEVGRLELQGEFHQGVRNVSGSFIGDGVFGRTFWALARHRGRSGLYSSISSFMRKLLPSMMTVSAWCSTRSRMAEVRVLSLLKICDQCL